MSSSSTSTSKEGGVRSSLLQKANGGIVTISDEARKRSSELVGKWSDPSHQTPSSSSYSNSTTGQAVPSSSRTGRVSSLLQTARGSNVVISEGARQKAEQFLVRTDKENANPQPKPAPAITEGTTRVSSLLQKAGGGQVVLSENAQRQGAALLHQWNATQAPSSSSASTNKFQGVNNVSNPSTTKKVSSLLQKANGGSVVVSDEALLKAQSMFQEAAPETPSNALVNPAEHRVSSLLQKASGGKVTISETSSKKAMQILQPPNEGSSSSAAATTRPPSKAHVPPRHVSTHRQVITPVVHKPQNEFMYNTCPHIPPAPNTVPPHVGIVESVHNFLTPVLNRSDLLAEPIYWHDILPQNLISTLDPRLSVLRKLWSSHLLLQGFDTQGRMQPALPWNSNAVVSTLTKTTTLTVQIIQFLRSVLQIPLTSWPEQKWILMQFNWILWTLVSWERKLPELYLGQLCSMANIVACLRMRHSIYYCPNPLVKKAHPSASKKRKSDSLAADVQQLVGIKRPHKTAREHFAYKGAMSPLQRCADIACLVWPLCLVVSIVPGSTHTSKLQVTDGWWWLPANIDPYLQHLIDRNLLQDGFKITVFQATFRQDGHDEQTSINLTYNAVRKARSDAHLGFIAPHFLTRGISLVSIHENGGPIYGFRFCAEKLLPTAYKIRIEDRQSDSNNVLLDCHGFCMNAQELRYVKAQIEAQQDKRCQELRDDNMGEDNSMPMDSAGPWSISLHGHQDILARCLLSGAQCWIRLPVSASLSDDGAHDDGNQIKVMQDQQYLVSNLKVVKMANLSTKLLVLSNTSSLQKLKLTPSEASLSVVTPKKATPLQSGETLLFAKGHCKSLANLTNLLRLPQSGGDTVSSLTEGEVSMKMTVVDWFGVDKLTDNPFAVSTLRLLCMDTCRYSVELTYPIMTKQLDKMPWLKKDAQIQVQFASVIEVDTVHEIIRLHRNERTCVSVLFTSASSTAVSTVKKLPPVAETSSDVKRRKFTTPQINRRSVVTPSISAVKNDVQPHDVLSEIAESCLVDERMRIRALRTNQTFYQSLACGRLLTCRKMSLLCSMEVLVDTYEGMFFTEEFEWSVIRLRSLCESRDMVLNTVPAGAVLDAVVDKKYLDTQLAAKEPSHDTGHYIAVLQAFFDPIIGTFQFTNSLKMEHLCTFLGEH